jgi:hypothetical protein
MKYLESLYRVYFATNTTGYQIQITVLHIAYYS